MRSSPAFRRAPAWVHPHPGKNMLRLPCLLGALFVATLGMQGARAQVGEGDVFDMTGNLLWQIGLRNGGADAPPGSPGPAAATRPAPLAVQLGASSLETTPTSPVTVSTTVGGGKPPYSYSWSLDNVPKSTRQPMVTAKLATAGVHRVHVDVTDSNTPPQAVGATIALTVVDDLTVVLSADQAVVPQNDNLTATALVRGGVQPYVLTWVVDGVTQAGGGASLVKKLTTVGSHVVAVHVTDSSRSAPQEDDQDLTVQVVWRGPQDVQPGAGQADAGPSFDDLPVADSTVARPAPPAPDTTSLMNDVANDPNESASANRGARSMLAGEAADNQNATSGPSAFAGLNAAPANDPGCCGSADAAPVAAPAAIAPVPSTGPAVASAGLAGGGGNPAAPADGPAGVKEVRIMNPVVGGLPLDLCSYQALGSQCGSPPAIAYCKSKGYATAGNDSKWVSMPSTRGIADGGVCKSPPGAYCNGYLWISCRPSGYRG